MQLMWMDSGCWHMIQTWFRCPLCEGPFIDHVTSLNRTRLALVESVQGRQLAGLHHHHTLLLEYLLVAGMICSCSFVCQYSRAWQDLIQNICGLQDKKYHDSKDLQCNESSRKRKLCYTLIIMLAFSCNASSPISSPEGNTWQWKWQTSPPPTPMRNLQVR
jgi:hypothetical protein